MTSTDEWLRVESLDLEAQGVATTPRARSCSSRTRCPARRCRSTVHRRKNNWEQATSPRGAGQPAARRAALPALRGLRRLQDAAPACRRAGRDQAARARGCAVAPRQGPAEQLLRPIEGPAWGYRQRARLSVRYVVKKGKVLVGFHERKSSYVADMDSCEVCRASARLLVPLRELVGAMRPRTGCRRSRSRSATTVTALVLRHLEPLGGADLERLRRSRRRMASSGGCSRRGRTRCTASTGRPRARLCAAQFGIRMPFRPTDFTQVNRDVNRVLVARAVRLLAPRAGRARDRLVLRARQLHAAARDTRRLGARHRRQPGAVERAPTRRG